MRLAALLLSAAVPLASALMHPPWLPRVNIAGLTGQAGAAAAVRAAEASSARLAALPPYDTRYFAQKVDHFNPSTAAGPWQQRYLTSTFHYKPGGPLLFYTGNEGDIVNFYQNTGFIFTLAEQFGALVVFCEHRYFGESWPFGTAKQSFLPQNRGYLTVEQALRDYAVIIPFLLRENNMPEDAAVIAVGGSCVSASFFL
jgi:hypothetical protein